MDSLIPNETEFFGHCSNLQAWAEQDYDTRLLHRNIAFPLLKKLTEAGDPLAKKHFREEIVERYNTGNDTVRTYLEIEGYFKYLSPSEKDHLTNDGVVDTLKALLSGGKPP